MADRNPIPWAEWEAQAERLLRAQRDVGSTWNLSSAKQLLARLLGRAHWHEVEQGLLWHDRLPWDRPTITPFQHFPPPPERLDEVNVRAWLGQVHPTRPATLAPGVWELWGADPWAWLAPLLIEGHRHGHWALQGAVALVCLEPSSWPALQKLHWSAATLRSIEPALQALDLDGQGAALSSIHRAWQQAWERRLSD